MIDAMFARDLQHSQDHAKPDNNTHSIIDM